MDRRIMENASAEGRRWADEKAAGLEGTSPLDWPDDWEPAWNGELGVKVPPDGGLSLEDLTELQGRAELAATLRWNEILETERATLDARVDTVDDELSAVRLYEALREHVPSGLAVARDGPRVFLFGSEPAEEVTVTSLADAMRAIGDWQERHLGR